MTVRRFLSIVLFLASILGVSAQKRADLQRPQLNEAPVKLVAMGESAPPITVTKVDRTHINRWGRYICNLFIDGDTIPVFRMNDVNVYGSHLLLTQKEIKKNSKLIRNVKIMLPYAREAKRRLDKLEVEIANMPAKERKAALKKAEKDIEAEYKKDLKRRTYSQGLVLIKLIDRETSHSAYSLVRDLRGSFRAGLYQACARLFGYNLKSEFNPSKDSKDNLIDRIVKSIDYGAL